VGKHPFSKGGEVATYQQIVSLGTKYLPQLEYPSTVHEDTVGLINALAKPKPAERKGTAPQGGFVTLQKDPFFTGVDWANIEEANSPFEKIASNAIDTLCSEPIQSSLTSSFASPYQGSGWHEQIGIYM
jgi:hypothetical protein